MNKIDAQLLSPPYIESPYVTYDLIRSKGPVYWSEPWSAWLVTRYELARMVLNDYVHFSNRGRYTLYLNSTFSRCWKTAVFSSLGSPEELAKYECHL